MIDTEIPSNGIQLKPIKSTTIWNVIIKSFKIIHLIEFSELVASN